LRASGTFLPVQSQRDDNETAIALAMVADSLGARSLRAPPPALNLTEGEGRAQKAKAAGFPAAFLWA
jgi:hypothetical protein